MSAKVFATTLLTKEHFPRGYLHYSLFVPVKSISAKVCLMTLFKKEHFPKSYIFHSYHPTSHTRICDPTKSLRLRRLVLRTQNCVPNTGPPRPTLSYTKQWTSSPNSHLIPGLVTLKNRCGFAASCFAHNTSPPRRQPPQQPGSGSPCSGSPGSGNSGLYHFCWPFMFYL